MMYNKLEDSIISSNEMKVSFPAWEITSLARQGYSLNDIASFYKVEPRLITLRLIDINNRDTRRVLQEYQ